MSSIRLINGQWLLVGGEVAIAEDCCCEPEEPDWRCSFCTAAGVFNWSQNGQLFGGLATFTPGWKYLDSITYTMSGYFNTIALRTTNYSGGFLGSGGPYGLVQYSTGWSCLNTTIVVPVSPPCTNNEFTDTVLGQVQIKANKVWQWPNSSNTGSVGPDGCWPTGTKICDEDIAYSIETLFCDGEGQNFLGAGRMCCGDMHEYDVIARTNCCGNLQLVLQCPITGVFRAPFQHFYGGQSPFFLDYPFAIYGGAGGGITGPGTLLSPFDPYGLLYSGFNYTWGEDGTRCSDTNTQWSQVQVRAPSDTSDDCLKCELTSLIPDTHTIRIEATFNWLTEP